MPTQRSRSHAEWKISQRCCSIDHVSQKVIPTKSGFFSFLSLSFLVATVAARPGDVKFSRPLPLSSAGGAS